MKKVFIAAILLMIGGTAFAQKHKKAPELKIVKPIKLNGVNDITISGDEITGDDLDCIQLTNCKNIHITHCRLISSKGFGVRLWKCSNILIDSNYMGDVRAGVYAQDCPDGGIRVNYNAMLNMQGPFPQASFVQFNHVGGPNNRICYNKLENEPGKSHPEDAINVYKSNGVEGDPILIDSNWIKGGSSPSGAGVTLGDQGGSYQVAQNNIIINTGAGGMQIAGGSHIQIINNSIFGKAFPYSHVGLGYGNWSGQPSTDITISGNKVRWVSGKPQDQRDGSTTREFNVSFQRSAGKPNGWDTNVLNADIDENMKPVINLKLKEVK